MILIETFQFHCKAFLFFLALLIIEAQDSVVTVKKPLFKTNVAEFDACLEKMGKTVEKGITDYHVGSTVDHDMVMTTLPTSKAIELAFDRA